VTEKSKRKNKEAAEEIVGGEVKIRWGKNTPRSATKKKQN
jgi:hypothetical protein